MRNSGPRSMRRIVAGICWLGAAAVLVTMGKDVGTIFEWSEIVFLSWGVARIGFLLYAGILLWDADYEIDSLKQTQVRLEEIIGELQNSR